MSDGQMTDEKWHRQTCWNCWQANAVDKGMYVTTQVSCVGWQKKIQKTIVLYLHMYGTAGQQTTTNKWFVTRKTRQQQQTTNKTCQPTQQYTNGTTVKPALATEWLNRQLTFSAPWGNGRCILHCVDQPAKCRDTAPSRCGHSVCSSTVKKTMDWR